LRSVSVQGTCIEQSVHLSFESPAVKKRAAVKRRLYVCSSYSETIIITILKSVARIRLVKTEKTKRVLVICEVLK
jgi:hypothetical protein